MMKKIGVLVIWLIVAALPAVAADQVQPVPLKANEAQSMLALFNRTVVSGGDVELIAGLAAKLRAAHEAGRQLDDPEKTVALPLNPEEIRYCLAVIARSTFEARFAGLVLGMKEKLSARLVPANPPDTSGDRP